MPRLPSTRRPRQKLQKKTGAQKHEELKNREPPLRGEEAKPKIAAMHEQAEHRHTLQIEHKALNAAKHNAKAVSVASETKASRATAQRERKQRVDENMLAHSARKRERVEQVRAKGALEVSKVIHTVAAQQEMDEINARIGARIHEDSMLAAEERRTAKLIEVAQRGAHESDKVDEVAAKLEAAAAAKAAQLDSAAEAAAERRALHLGALAAKGAAESAKVSRVSGLGRKGHEAAEEAGDSEAGGASRPALALSAVGGIHPTAESVSSDASMILLLMRGGAPNIEVLNARGFEEYVALAHKHGITLPAGIDIHPPSPRAHLPAKPVFGHWSPAHPSTPLTAVASRTATRPALASPLSFAGS